MIRRWWLVLLPLLACLLAGCAEWSVPYQLDRSGGPEMELAAGQPAGQTFVATHAGLSGVELFLSPRQTGTGQIRLHLRADAQASDDLVEVAIPVAQITQPAFYRFSFVPRPDSENRYYYAFAEMAGAGTVLFGTASGSTYLDGALYVDHRPVDAQMAFRLVYSLPMVAWELVQVVGEWLVILAVTWLLFIVPGWALLGLVRLEPHLIWGEKLGLSVGVSLAVYPVLFLWTDLFKLHLGSLYAWLPAGLGLVALAWQNRHWRLPALRSTWSSWLRSGAPWPDLTFIVLMGLVFAVRFWAAHGLDVPMWGDSYQHTMITQLLVDHGGLFNAWQPYADLQTLTYHFGFHTDAAAFHWLTGIGVTQSVLWTGQIMNGLAVLALYPLAVRLGRSPWAGVGAILVAGLLSPMPMAYINWGRYTQLTGQSILPAVASLVWILLEAKRRDWRLLGLASLTLGGLGLSHYRVLIFAVIFLVVVLFSELSQGRQRIALSRLAALGLGAGIIFLPWFVRIASGHILTTTAIQLTTPPSQLTEADLVYNALGNWGNYLPLRLWLALVGAASWGLCRRNVAATQVAGWWGLSLLAANPQWLGLPGAGVISNFAVLIAAYIPAGILLGGAVGWGVAWWRDSRWSTVRPWLALAGPIGLGVILIGVGLWGARLRFGDRQVVDGALVTRPDLRAAAWIQTHTPSDARFLINSFFVPGGTATVGADGGWWLPLTAHRSTTIPPLNYVNEQGPFPGYIEWTNHLPAVIQSSGIDSLDAVNLLHERDVTYIYIGQRRGQVNFSGPTLEPDQLLQSPHFRAIYQQDRVCIFAVQP